MGTMRKLAWKEALLLMSNIAPTNRLPPHQKIGAK
jgi:hypothetical protein